MDTMDVTGAPDSFPHNHVYSYLHVVMYSSAAMYSDHPSQRIGWKVYEFTGPHSRPGEYVVIQYIVKSTAGADRRRGGRGDAPAGGAWKKGRRSQSFDRMRIEQNYYYVYSATRFTRAAGRRPRGTWRRPPRSPRTRRRARGTPCGRTMSSGASYRLHYSVIPLTTSPPPAPPTPTALPTYCWEVHSLITLPYLLGNGLRINSAET